MREYKFRGRRIDTGEWVYGDIIHSAWKTFTKDCNDKYTNPRRLAENTADFRCIEVDPETIGQYTGLNDKNGVEMYEGDIVTYPDGDGGYEYCDEIINSGVVTWSNISLCYFATNNNTAEFPTAWEYIEEIQVIGNIHDNPELLDG